MCLVIFTMLQEFRYLPVDLYFFDGAECRIKTPT